MKYLILTLTIVFIVACGKTGGSSGAAAPQANVPAVTQPDPTGPELNSEYDGTFTNTMACYLGQARGGGYGSCASVCAGVQVPNTIIFSAVGAYIDIDGTTYQPVYGEFNAVAAGPYNLVIGLNAVPVNEFGVIDPTGASLITFNSTCKVAYNWAPSGT
jgi:hypothetical protein